MLERSGFYYGSAINLVQWVECFVEKGCKVDVALCERGDIEEHIIKAGGCVRLVPLPSGLNLYNKKAFESFFSVIKSIVLWSYYGFFSSMKLSVSPCDLVVVNNTRSFVFYFFSVVSIRIFKRKPVLWRVQSDTPVNLVVGFFLGFTASRILIHGNEAGARRALGANYKIFKGKIHYCYNPIDIKKYDILKAEVVDDAFENFCDQGFVVGSVSTISPEKGVGDLVDAIVKLNGKGVQVKFIHIGGVVGEENEEYLNNLFNKIEGSGFSDRFMFLGFQNNIPAYMEYFDIFALVSYMESMPYVISEAMASAKPVISTNVGAVSEMVQDYSSGLIVDAGDVSAIEEAVESYLRRRDLAEAHGARGRYILESKFSLDAYLSDLYRLCKALVRSE